MNVNAPQAAPRPAPASRHSSLRRRLLVGILLPVLVFVAIDAASLYRSSLDAADMAYDRTLLASAKAIGEQLGVQGAGANSRLVAAVPYSALEAFEADNRSRMFYKVTRFDGEPVSGFADLPPPRPAGSQRNVYAALVHFYDDHHHGEPVRMAVLLQPVAGTEGQGMATIQVAETLELRRTLARTLLVRTLVQQVALTALIALVVVFVVQRATRPVRELSAALSARPGADLSPLPEVDAPRELRPMVDAANALMARLAHLLEHQKRFVRDASHQLRTPLAVLKTQVQSALRGDVEPTQALQEVRHTVERDRRTTRPRGAREPVKCWRPATSTPPPRWPRSTPRWPAPANSPTRCWRWRASSSCASRTTPRSSTGPTSCARWRWTFRR